MRDDGHGKPKSLHPVPRFSPRSQLKNCGLPPSPIYEMIKRCAVARERLTKNAVLNDMAIFFGFQAQLLSTAQVCAERVMEDYEKRRQDMRLELSVSRPPNKAIITTPVAR